MPSLAGLLQGFGDVSRGGGFEKAFGVLSDTKDRKERKATQEEQKRQFDAQIAIEQNRFKLEQDKTLRERMAVYAEGYQGDINGYIAMLNNDPDIKGRQDLINLGKSYFGVQDQIRSKEMLDASHAMLTEHGITIPADIVESNDLEALHTFVAPLIEKRFKFEQARNDELMSDQIDTAEYNRLYAQHQLDMAQETKQYDVEQKRIAADPLLPQHGVIIDKLLVQVDELSGEITVNQKLLDAVVNAKTGTEFAEAYSAFRNSLDQQTVQKLGMDDFRDEARPTIPIQGSLRGAGSLAKVAESQQGNKAQATAPSAQLNEASPRGGLLGDRRYPPNSLGGVLQNLSKIPSREGFGSAGAFSTIQAPGRGRGGLGHLNERVTQRGTPNLGMSDAISSAYPGEDLDKLLQLIKFGTTDLGATPPRVSNQQLRQGLLGGLGVQEGKRYDTSMDVGYLMEQLGQLAKYGTTDTSYTPFEISDQVVQFLKELDVQK